MPNRLHWASIAAVFMTLAGTFSATAAGDLNGHTKYAALVAAIASGLLAVGDGLRSMGSGVQNAQPTQTVIHVPATPIVVPATDTAPSPLSMPPAG